MNVLVGCERSGRVREAFRKLGHSAWSADIVPADDGSNYHYTSQLQLLRHWSDWDLGIFFPPCTHLASSGARWFKEKQQEQQDAIEFCRWILALPIARIAMENPIGVLSTAIRKPDQIIQPWMFGHGETKATCLWLKNLPKLQSTNIVEGRVGRVWREPPHPDRAMRRSITYQGIADAMAEQWGSL